MRLNAYLAKAGVASRRGADLLIKTGRVFVNGKSGQLNMDVTDEDRVELDGRQVKLQQNRYILLNKPKNTVTTLRDPDSKQTVLDFIKISERVVPVGRLDYGTTGALLLTNDGDLAHKLMHPSFEVDKVYEAQVSGEITDDKLKKLEQGVKLEDGLTAPAHARKIAHNKVELIIHEGRKHQVKRMLEAVDLPVSQLHRCQYGPLKLGRLRPGEWRNLTKEEIKQLIGSGSSAQ